MARLGPLTTTHECQPTIQGPFRVRNCTHSDEETTNVDARQALNAKVVFTVHSSQDVSLTRASHNSHDDDSITRNSKWRNFDCKASAHPKHSLWCVWNWGRFSSSTLFFCGYWITTFDSIYCKCEKSIAISIFLRSYSPLSPLWHVPRGLVRSTVSSESANSSNGTWILTKTECLLPSDEFDTIFGITISV